MPTWFAYALLKPHWVIPEGTCLPKSFGERVSLKEIIPVVSEISEADNLRHLIQQEMDSEGIRHCLAVEYETNEPPGFLENRPHEWSAHDEAQQQARSAHMALWLIRPTPLTFTTVAIAERKGQELNTCAVTTYGPTFTLGTSASKDYNAEDLNAASLAFKALMRASMQGPVRTAGLVITKLLCDSTWEFRFLLMWLAMESLFGPEDSRETSFRLSQRVALFLESDPIRSNELFRKVKDSYSWRSKIVHGFRLAKLNDEKLLGLLLEMEDVLRRGMLTILNSEERLAIFDGPSRESYLDGLAFRHS